MILIMFDIQPFIKHREPVPPWKQPGFGPEPRARAWSGVLRNTYIIATPKTPEK